MARMISNETPLMHEIHAIESVYGSILNAPDDDPHLLAAHKIANGGRTDAEIKHAEAQQRIARLTAIHRAREMAKHEAIVNGYRELGSLSFVVEKMGYSYSVVQRHVSDARKYGELPKKGKRNDNQ